MLFITYALDMLIWLLFKIYALYMFITYSYVMLFRTFSYDMFFTAYANGMLFGTYANSMLFRTYACDMFSTAYAYNMLFIAYDMLFTEYTYYVSCLGLYQNLSVYQKLLVHIFVSILFVINF